MSKPEVKSKKLYIKLIDELFLFISGIKYFLKTNKPVVFSILTLSILCFGYEICNFTLSIDEEFYIASPKRPEVWLGDGRFGIFLFKKLFMAFNMFPPFFVTMVAVTFLFFSAVVWCYNFSTVFKKREISKFSLILFSVIYMSLPAVVPEFMMFSSYNIEVCLALLAIAVSISFIIQYNENKTCVSLFYACAFLTFSISVYQSFIPMFISAVCVISIFYLLFNDKELPYNYHFKNIIASIIVFFISFVSYYVINKFMLIFYPSSQYLNNFIGWNQYKSIGQMIISITDGLKIRFFVRWEIGGKLLCVSYIMFGLLSLCILFAPKVKKRIFTVLLIICLAASPFLLSYMFASITPLRAMQPILLVNAVIWLIIINLFNDVKIVKGIACVLALIIALFQVQMINRVFYGDHIRYEADVRTGNMIISDMAKEIPNYSQYPLVFVGRRLPDYGPVVIRNEVIGGSFFEWDNGSNGRMISFLNACGNNLKYPTSEQIEEGKTQGRDMPVWPEKGSIKVTGDKIIIKLSQ